jgi:hypothetical protein
LGVMLLDLITTRSTARWPFLRLGAMIGLTIVLLLLGLIPFADYFIHIGGLFLGFGAASMSLLNLSFGKCEGMIHTALALFQSSRYE